LKKQTLWRAANDDYLSQGYSFAESKEIPDGLLPFLPDEDEA